MAEATAANEAAVEEASDSAAAEDRVVDNAEKEVSDRNVIEDTDDKTQSELEKSEDGSFTPYKEMSPEYGESYREWSRESWNGSSPEEQVAIKTYVDAKANGYQLMNYLERGINNPNLEQQETREAVRSVCDNLAGRIERSECPEDTVLYRSVGDAEAQELLNKSNSDDNIIEHKGFMSTAISPEQASQFYGGNTVIYDGKEYIPMMRVNVPKGTPSLAMGSNPITYGSEGEVLLQRNSQLEINSVSPKNATYDPLRNNILYINATIK